MPRIAVVVFSVLLVWGTMRPISFAQQSEHESLAQLLERLHQVVEVLQQTARVDKTALTQAIANLGSVSV